MPFHVTVLLGAELCFWGLDAVFHGAQCDQSAACPSHCRHCVGACPFMVRHRGSSRHPTQRPQGLLAALAFGLQPWVDGSLKVPGCCSRGLRLAFPAPPAYLSTVLTFLISV